MTINNPNIIIKKGEEVYQTLKEELEKKHLGKYVAIDVESKEYFVADTAEEASHKAKEAHPDQISYLTKIGPERGVFTLRTFRGQIDFWNNRHIGLSGN